ncbi:hypothetical protein EFR01_34190 [Sinorhizobium fredii]|nr:hypothetical protein EFR01_34190 [Sinorhizobium fredii]GLS08312.1 hypothetical protein GCM10007864_19410 [Sinorhizobium fredii]
MSDFAPFGRCLRNKDRHRNSETASNACATAVPVLPPGRLGNYVYRLELAREGKQNKMRCCWFELHSM